MTPEERAVLERARVAVLATADGEGRPHAVPVCYAVLEPAAVPIESGEDGEADAGDESGKSGGCGEGGNGDRPWIVSAIDEKPKSTQDLRRVRDISANPYVALLVDRYREDWSKLAWVQVRGRARVLEPEDAGHDAAVCALEAEYDQYADHDLGDRPVIAIRVGRTVSWGALEEYV